MHSESLGVDSQSDPLVCLIRSDVNALDRVWVPSPVTFE